MVIVSFLLLVILIIPTIYLWTQVFASLKPLHSLEIPEHPASRFVIVIPAHDESAVIAFTVKRLKELDYPADLFSIHVIADYCTDDTAPLARQAGAIVHERDQGPREGKGAALNWGLGCILSTQNNCDAVVIFDADTIVDAQFLRIMDAHLCAGDQVIQGQHIISNPDDGLFPALVWAMFIVDNRFQNYGRTVLGWSAKNMGDSICFRADILRRLGWGKGLTEDYQFRHQLLLEGIHIVYEPRAKGYGEAPRQWQQVKAQRTRWVEGVYNASRKSNWRMLAEWFRRRDNALLDGALQTFFPSYSMLTFVCFGLLCIYILLDYQFNPIIESWMIGSWAILLVVFFIYPFIGLAAERAPVKAYLAILSGPILILLRIWLAFQSRFKKKPTQWIRTQHGQSNISG
ncbi:MAG TPA: glycosyltransferase family 2 protein [Anaerolineaceae bacterium]|nr:glycosyltransferase family 2 protein [Anaerolineaceae bacterium]